MSTAHVNQHIERLARLYRTAASVDMDVEALRLQLVEAASHVGPAAAELTTPQACEEYVTRLRGLARLALQLRDSLRNSAAAKPGAASCPRSTEHGGSNERK